MMLHTKYQGSRPYGFRQEDFFMFFPIKAYAKHVTPGAALFWPQGHNLNKLGRGPIGGATYQISRLSDWSEHLLVAHTTLLEISCRGSYYFANFDLIGITTF